MSKEEQVMREYKRQQAKERRRIEQRNKDRNKNKSKVTLAFAVYNHDWRRLKKSKHLSRNKTRMKRWRELRNDEYIVLTMYDVMKNTAYLMLSSGATLIVGLGPTRNEDIIVTVIPSKSKWTTVKPYKKSGTWPIVQIPGSNGEMAQDPGPINVNDFVG